MNDEQCPRCGSLFPAQRAWAYRSFAALFNPFNPVTDDFDTRVMCPNCKHVFDATAYRFFGLVSPRAMRVCALILVVGMLGTMLYHSLMQ
jgi:uncharacterized C2H2 Zn-finger protein